MAEWDVQATEPLRLTVYPKGGEPKDLWAVKDTTPAAGTQQPGDPWGVQQTLPASPQQQPSQPQRRSFFEGILDPVTRPFSNQPEMAREGLESMGKGVEAIRGGDRMAGGLQMLGGALEYTLSPVNAPIRRYFGEPTEKAFGIPKEHTELAVSLALPGIGFGKQIRQMLRPLEELVSPATVSIAAQDAAATLRSTGGRAARDTETTRAAMEPFHRTVNALPEAERLAFIDHVEGGARLPGTATSLHALADTLREAFELRKAKLQAMPSTQQMGFVDDYFPHFWQDPAKAKAFAEGYSGGAARQGSGASLKERTVPTIADGIAAGLKPVTTDPIEATMRYVQSMDRFIASTEALEAGKQAGTIQYVRPKTVGASGHPDSIAGAPEGYVKLEGRGSVRGDGSVAYAPADWARVYNNFISKGFHQDPTMGRIYDAAQMTSNAITSLELSFSGFHAFTMAHEAFISDLAKGVSQIVGAQPVRAAKSIMGAVAAPVVRAVQGHKFEQVYLGRTPGTPDMRKIVDLFTEAGARAVGTRHTRGEYQFSAMDNFWTSWKRGALRMSFETSAQRIRDAKYPVARGALEGAKQVGRIMDTVAYPLFAKYIPKLKNGAAYDTMSAWLQANPTASQAEQVAAARRIWDSIDNRFGEMVHDNLFWNAYGRQLAQLGLRSYSWTIGGTFREFGAGVVSAVRHPERMSIKSKDYDPRAAYAVAFPVGVAALGGVYQYLMTGKPPESVMDVVAPRTGGTAPGFGGRGEVEERARTPGYQKDVYGYWHHPAMEITAKMSTGARLAKETLSLAGGRGGSDWRGDPFVRPEATASQWFADYVRHVSESLVPISIKQTVQGRKTGTAIGPGQSMMGVTPAMGAFQDPEGTERGLKAMRGRDWQRKERYEKRQRALRGYED